MNENELGDEALVRAALAGNESAFETLMRRHTAAIRNLIARYFRNHSRVDDLAQETFVKAYFSLADYRGAAPLVFWLKRIAVRLCLDELKRCKREAMRLVPLEGRTNESIENSLPRNAEAEAQIHFRLWVEKILASLGPIDRMILILKEGEGYRDEEVAQLTGLSRANIKVRAFRLRHKLQKELRAVD